MFEIRTLTYRGAPVTDPLSARIDAEGGTIGRGAGNTLVLPDPERYVSRVQARVRIDGGRLWVANASSASPMFVNDRELEPGAEAEARAGDELRMGLYTLGVTSDAPVLDATVTPRPVTQADAAVAVGAPAAASPAAVEPPVAGAASTFPSSTPAITPPSAPAAIARPAAPAPSTPPLAPDSDVPMRGTVAALPVDPLQLEFGSGGSASNPLADLLAPASAVHPSASVARRDDRPARGLSPVAGAAPAPANPVPASAPAAAIPVPPSAPAAALPVPPSAPLSAIPAAPPPPADIWRELEGLAPRPPATAAADRRPTIPDDFDPFAQPSQAARNTADPLAELRASAVSLDSLANSGQAEADLLSGLAPLRDAVKPVLDDPNAGALDPLRRGDVVDPLALFGAEDPVLRSATTDVAHAPVADHVLEVGGFFRPPDYRPDPALPPPPAASPVPAAPASPPPSPILPEHLDLSPVRSAPAPVPGMPKSGGAAVEREEMLAGHCAAAPVEPGALTAGVARPAVADRASGDDPRERGAGAGSEELLQAFLAGAGIPGATVPGGLTPELMEKVGAVLAESVQGAIDLIAARGMVKREVRATVTMIVARNNNPLKFLPDSESALLQMFAQRVPGFIGPVEAMRDAFADLRAHELGLIAGMRAALAEVLRRFDPKALESRVESGAVDNVLPALRKAKLWDAYAVLYETVGREAQDDFQTLFGKAFLQAYEQEIERVRKSAEG